MWLVTWGWHVPAAFELAVRARAWHVVEHASFFATGALAYLVPAGVLTVRWLSPGAAVPLQGGAVPRYSSDSV